MNKSILIVVFLALLAFSCSRNDASQHDGSTTTQRAQIQPEKTLTKKEKMATVANGLPAPNAFFFGPDGEKKNTQDFEGKILFLDFWAMWCSPCLQQIPEILKVSEQYSNVEFLFISVDDDQNIWQEFVREKDWVKNSYWIGEDDEHPLYPFIYQDLAGSEMFQELELEGSNSIMIVLPTHVMISKEGIILSNDAPLPDSPEFEDLIKHYSEI